MTSPAGYFEDSTTSQQYEQLNYGSGLSGAILRHSHRLVEREFGPDVKFARVLEIGAGSGIHLQFVRHLYDAYVMTDGSAAMLEQASARRGDSSMGKVEFECADATRLHYEDNSFDRVIATHVLEHIPNPHLVLDEWWRVLKPSGVLSLVLPCDPGALWRLGRSFGPRKKAEQNGLPYDYVMALEHINSINNLKAITEYKFKDTRMKTTWWPVRLPWPDFNLIFCVNIWKPE